MTISRSLAKRQIAATRRYFHLLTQMLEAPPSEGYRHTPELHEAMDQLMGCTIELTRAVYQPNEGNKP